MKTYLLPATGAPTSLVRWGTDGLAYTTVNGPTILLSQGFPPPDPTVPPVPPVGPPGDPVPPVEIGAFGEYTALPPTRLLDTRINPGPLSAGRTIDVQIEGAAGVPSSDVVAVVLNVTATGPQQAGFLTVWPSDEGQPLISNVNYSAGLAQAAGAAAAGGLIPPSLVPTIIGATPGLDSFATVSGNDYSWGWNIGILIDIDKNTRVGAQYRSSIKFDLTGNVSFVNPALPTLPPTLAPVVASLAGAVNANLANGGITANIELPSITNVSLFSKLDNRWDVMADLQFTQWSTIQNLTFVRTTGALLQNTPENFKSAWRYSLGVNYHYTDQWMFRAGVAYDQSPVQDEFRTPRLPDSDRTWLSFGAQYKMNNAWKFDVGATYIWISNGSINTNAGSTAQSGLINGTYNNNVVIVSGQATYSF